MNQSLPVRFVGRAGREIGEAGRWWKEHRPAAPGAIDEELQKALELICANPAIGARATNTSLSGVRRVHLSRIRYHLYYRVLSVPKPTVEVLAFWHMSRGGAPGI